MGGSTQIDGNPKFNVGLDEQFLKLKNEVLKNGLSILGFTGLGGSWKTTLATKLCWDEQVENDTCSSYWSNIQAAEAEVLILTLHTNQYSNPEIINQISKLIVSISSFTALKNLKRLSLYMCNMSQVFETNTIPISEALPNLVELSIDYCKDMVQLPTGLCNITSLVNLTISNCHKLSSLPKEIGNLENLEHLRLSSCTDLEWLPDSIGRLSNLRLLDISKCISLRSLPEDIGNLSNLRSLYMINCAGCELPYSVINFENLKVICDEETAISWEDLNTNIKIEIPQADVNLNWLHPI
ncbi:PREDICTED: probable disease resistance protein At5g66900 isoform X1 [Lupinus angustifolius]|uniref:probable disease resistance protein At5g66900 isoform X1 n=1 Tax=Lupinus angustifolius TaxID=3871 RepID=UPI00092F2010|nr:PREDICTED: probable disease resistance protein At5g66900 isoform X1 [Lupinus angustifolius]